MSFKIGNAGPSFNKSVVQDDMAKKGKALKQEDENLGVEQRRFEQREMGLNLDEAKTKHAEALISLGMPEYIIQEGPKAVKEFIDSEGLEKLDGGFGSFLGLKLGKGKRPEGPKGSAEHPEGPPPSGEKNAQITSAAEFSFSLASGTDDFSFSQVEILESLSIPQSVISEGETAVAKYADFNNIELPKENFSFGSV